MTMPATSRVAISAHGQQFDLEYAWIDTHRRDRPLLIFLHEGLGSVAMWRDFPARLCAESRCRGLVYSRRGYGQSTPRPKDEPWPADFMHREADEALPALLHALQLDAQRPVLFGHSDGGSIALLYAALNPQRVSGVVVAAPHIFVEAVTLRHIAAARQAYQDTDLPQRLARYHADADGVFWGWNRAWLDPGFGQWSIEDHLPALRCPALAIQGLEDEYGSLAQIEGIQRLAPQTQLLTLPQCRHSPHKDQPQAVIRAVADFVGGLAGH
ncbi:alpha/beta fold hydrolase [Bordetella holmesii]|uniref:Alpha/beta hydrolase family protein n=2 Tax=Bordetella holmesii TaxID=35814 RepID=A0A158M4C5_9BORD|nr:esterase family protein [Bordetella holmesii ATCC 51541]AIT26669.1 esterase family protein [Bordetella holmesii 44057]AMD45637.1 alpha/beta hydrolase [Bordetella holmesii H558]AMD48937.1 alpha/beta hydrolase [Bordetella holmesii F627]AOB34523.1 alpha/beta hydrolase [Bordetella holmesii]EWM43413.1 esterase family protein [Bordetella holmesii 41130]EWM47253.1 esterase family protein [Bordetella holmesii 35009]EWM51410.1 esterase family protein [Bordetella holmesii 70147]EXF88664.1 esterase